MDRVDDEKWYNGWLFKVGLVVLGGIFTLLGGWISRANEPPKPKGAVVLPITRSEEVESTPEKIADLDKLRKDAKLHRPDPEPRWDERELKLPSMEDSTYFSVSIPGLAKGDVNPVPYQSEGSLEVHRYANNRLYIFFYISSETYKRIMRLRAKLITSFPGYATKTDAYQTLVRLPLGMFQLEHFDDRSFEFTITPQSPLPFF